MSNSSRRRKIYLFHFIYLSIYLSIIITLFLFVKHIGVMVFDEENGILHGEITCYTGSGYGPGVVLGVLFLPVALPKQGSRRCATVIVSEMDLVSRVEILNETAFHFTPTQLGKA